MFLAFVRSVVEAPEMFAVLNIAFAGSVVSTPMLMLGTAFWLNCQELICENENPAEILWVPLLMLRLSKSCFTGEFRREGELLTVALVIPAALIPKLNPPWLVNCPGEISGKNNVVPPVNPPRSSFTMCGL